MIYKIANIEKLIDEMLKEFHKKDKETLSNLMLKKCSHEKDIREVLQEIRKKDDFLYLKHLKNSGQRFVRMNGEIIEIDYLIENYKNLYGWE